MACRPEGILSEVPTPQCVGHHGTDECRVSIRSVSALEGIEALHYPARSARISQSEPFIIPLRLYRTAQSAWLTGSWSNSCLSATFPARLAVAMV
jgi:hypothetical protein